MSITQSGGAVIAYPKGIRSNFGAAIGAVFDGTGQGSLTITVEVTELGTITFNGNAVRKSHGKEQQCRAAEPRRSALQLRRSGQCLAKRKDAKGGETAERLLALSAAAVDAYLAADDPHRPGVCTAYAAAKANSVTAGESVAWWLHTPGTESGCTAVVNAQGETDENGIPADSAAVGVRPAFWLHLS